MSDLMHRVAEIARCAALFRQEELTPLEQAIQIELGGLGDNCPWTESEMSRRMDAYLEENGKNGTGLM